MDLWFIFLQATPRAIAVVIFRCVRHFFNAMQSILWQFNGTTRQLRESHLSQNYNSSIQVVDILWMYKFDRFSRLTLNDYIYAQNRFESPNFILNNDHVTLMTLTNHNAVFVIAREKGMQLWKRQFNPFMLLAQLDYCDQLAFVPLPVFRQMSKELGDPVAPVAFMFNTARCGSTLLTQILENTGNCVTISEPRSLDYVSTYFRKNGDSPEIRELAKHAVRWICRPLTTFKPLIYFIKFRAATAVSMRLFGRVFPSSKFLFMYREPVQTARSLYRMSYVVPMTRVTCILGLLSARLTEICFDLMGWSGQDFRTKFDNDFTYGILLYAVTCKSYLDFLADGFEAVGVRYEDVVNDPQFAITAIFKYVGLPVELVELGKKGLETDSQENSILAAGRLRTREKLTMTRKSEEAANRLLSSYGLPLIGDNHPLQGTITKDSNS